MTNLSVLKIDADHIAKSLEEARATLTGSATDTLLDFSAVRRIDPDALRMLDELARAAEEKSVKVSLLGVNVDIYKVLKLVRLAPRFSFPADGVPGSAAGD